MLTVRECERIEDEIDAKISLPSYINNAINEMDIAAHTKFCEAIAKIMSHGKGVLLDAAINDLSHVIKAAARSMETRCAMEEKRRISHEAPDGDDYEDRKLAERDPMHFSGLAEMSGRRL